MKKLFIKFKHWLIKKLGGYVEQKQIARIIVEKENIPVRTIRIEERISYGYKMRFCANGLDELRQRILTSFADRIMGLILENQLLDFKIGEDIMSGYLVLRGDLKICQPRDPLSAVDAFSILQEKLGM